jgi:hypothetical protein
MYTSSILFEKKNHDYLWQILFDNLWMKNTLESVFGTLYNAVHYLKSYD